LCVPFADIEVRLNTRNSLHQTDAASTGKTMADEKSHKSPETSALETVVTKILETANAQNQKMLEVVNLQNQALLEELRRMRQEADNEPERAERQAVRLTQNPAHKRLLQHALEEHEREKNEGSRLHPEESISCVSAHGFTDENGILHSATFDANVQNGRVIRLDNYKVPEAIFTSKLQGGICPMSPKDMLSSDSTEPSKRFKSWVYETFNKPDLLTYVGKPKRVIDRIAVAVPAAATTAPVTTAVTVKSAAAE
jgi:hypothetical protein